MVDWDAVEKLRSKGWDWDRIAAEPKVAFHAEEGAGEPGRALRALYYQRRSKAQRRPSKSNAGSDKSPDSDTKAPWNLARVGYILVPLAGVWFLLAYFVPSPIGTYLPAIPYIGLFLAAAGFLLVWGLLRTQERWSKAMRTSVISGIVLGLVISGGFTLVAELNSCPTLPTISSAEPQGWEKANAAAWQENGKPVFYFVGSIACPYCSASSWAMKMALDAFGTVSGTSLGTSNPNDHPLTSIPEVNLASASINSQYVSLVILEGTDDLQITIPPANTCTEQAYVSAYDTGGSIPFVVINGQYVHVGTLVDPSVLQPYSPQAIQGQLANQSEPAWSAVTPAAYMMEAFLVKANGGQPTSLATNPNVAPLLAQITEAAMRAETVHALLLMGILVGLAFALFAGYETLNPSAEGVCSVNSYISCQKIDTSGHTSTLGIADWVWGVGGFAVLLLLDVPLYRTWKREWLLPVAGLSLVGAILSVYFAYVELVVIQGLCLVCLSAYLSNVVVLACAAYLMRLSASERRTARAATDAAV